MPAELPNLSGVATRDLVETIGSGSFKASYINWSRTMELLRQHAPGWMAETVYAADGSLVHKAPKGGYLLIRFRHIDGTTTPELPQAVMDNRNNAIEFDRITSRDITDTQRRGTCLAAAFHFGLAYELWAKMPLESGYANTEASDEPTSSKKIEKPSVSVKKESKKADPIEADVSKAEFVSIAVNMGLCQPAIDDLITKINNDFDKGIKTLKSKDEKFVEDMNSKFQASMY
jgi:hypothetical protein